jgi:hypothetical protein
VRISNAASPFSDRVRSGSRSFVRRTPDHRVDRPFVDGETGMTLRDDDLDQLGEGDLDRYRGDIDSRGHHLARDRLGELEHAVDHLPLVLLHHTLLVAPWRRAGGSPPGYGPAGGARPRRRRRSR